MLKQKPILIAAVITCSCLVGCATTYSGSSLESKAARMSPELLRSQVLRYKAEVEKETETVDEFYAKWAPVDSPFTSDTAKAISDALLDNPQMRETMKSASESYHNYLFFYEKLKEKGGDLNGLELDIKHDYEKYFSPPIKETPAPNSEFQTTEAA